MKKGTKVKWTLASGVEGGAGTVITDEDETGHVQVRIESNWASGQKWQNEVQHVISCAVTWLAVDAAA